MQLTNLMFVVLIGIGMFTGMWIFMIDVYSNINGTAIPANSSLAAFSNASSELNDTMGSLNTTIAPLVGTAATSTNGDVGIAAALGYLFGGIGAVATLLSRMPNMFLAFLNVFVSLAGVFFPSYLLIEIILGITIIAILGALYYLLKVK